jgi:Mg2+ and Co2+ transporter CorA
MTARPESTILRVTAGAEMAAPLSTCRVLQHHGSSEMHFSRETVEKLLAGGFFWLDLDRPDAADFEILTDVFKFHPLAVEDSEHFGQGAKLDEYDHFVFIVAFGAAPDADRLVEVHCSSRSAGRPASSARTSAGSSATSGAGRPSSASGSEQR